MSDLIGKLNSLAMTVLAQIAGAKSLDELEQIRVSVLGKKGSLSEVLRGLGSVDASERPKIGAVSNQVKAQVEEALFSAKEKLGNAEISAKIAKERIDITLPARTVHMGSLHPVTQTVRKITHILGKIGFDLTTGPEIETDFMNFEAVNIPADHPARDMQDTFFVGPGVVLRTQTSPVQMRAMR